MAKSAQIDSRSISAVADDVGRHRITANRTLRPQWTNSITADDSLSLSDGGEKIIRFIRVLLRRLGKADATEMWRDSKIFAGACQKPQYRG